MTDEDMTTAEFAAPAPSTTDSVPTAAASETAASQGSEVNPKEPASERADDAGELSSQEPVATRSLTVVLRALGRHHSRALMLERLAYVAMEEFLGMEGRPPTKLLKLPNGAKFTVESDDALELNIELSRMALEERFKLQQIEAAGVHVNPSAVDIVARSAPTGVAGPAGECMVDNPRHKAASPTVATKRGMTGAGQAGSADEWDKVMGVAAAPAR
jgi:hypothetical protein